MFEAIKKEKFREDLYYRLSTVEINIPPLRERQEDIHLLFRKFASDFALKYKMPTIKLNDDAVDVLLKFRWNGNIRQLRNVAEQISVLEQNRTISTATLKGYLPNASTNLPAVINTAKSESDFSNEREILYKVLFDMKSDLNDLKKLTMELMKSGNANEVQKDNEHLIQKIYGGKKEDAYDNDFEDLEVLPIAEKQDAFVETTEDTSQDKYHFAEEIEEEETLSLHDKELELIKKSLERHNGKRKLAAAELGISERTLYRKIKQYDL
jgi:transcriptional regulator with PAS, ATPase and Fis domain